MMGQYQASDKNWWIRWITSNTLQFEARWPFKNTQIACTWNPSVDTWYHIAIVRDTGGIVYIFIDGIDQVLTQDVRQGGFASSITGDVNIGFDPFNSHYMNGWMDEIRISDVARWTTDFTPPTVPYAGDPPPPPPEFFSPDKYVVEPQYPRRKKPPAKKGSYAIAGLETPVPIKLDKWRPLLTPPAREKKRNPANTTKVVFVDFTAPTLAVPLVDKWLSQFDKPRRKKEARRQSDYAISFRAAFSPINGNYTDDGFVSFSIDQTHYEAATYKDIGEVSFSITQSDVEDFQLEDSDPVKFSITWPQTGVESYDSGVPGFVQVSVMVDGVNESPFIKGVVTVTREDNTAARFSLPIEANPAVMPPRKPVELINKTVEIAFAAADMQGIVRDTIEIFKGVCKRVSFNEDIKTVNMTGYDHGGVHQTKGEFISENITTVLEGAIYANKAETLNLGHSPIWGVQFSGNTSVVDGEDYFVDTYNGLIVIPISSRILQFPGTFTYNYASPFASMRDIIQAIASKKGWIIKEDNITIADYSSQAAHPVLSISDESCIDMCRKFLELSGAKVESNLYPSLRVYSEVANFVSPLNTVIVDEDIIFEETLVFTTDFDNLLNEQTVQSVQKVNANISIGALETLATYEGSQGTQNPNNVENGQIGIDYTHNYVLVEKRLKKQNISSISFAASGEFSFFTGFKFSRAFSNVKNDRH
jgi:hypothetical protein